METYKKIVILCIILLTFYILYRLLTNRWKMQGEHMKAKLSAPLESFTDGIQIQNTKNAELPLTQDCVKASFHSAYNAATNKIDLDLLSKIVKRGVRFLDFEVYSFQGEAVVGYCSKLNPEANTIESSNAPDDVNTRLTTVFKKINMEKPPELTDPLFIHLRIKSSLPALYSKVAQAVEGAFNGVLYSNPSEGQNGKWLDLEKPLSAYRGKTIIVIDKINTTVGYTDYADCKNSVDNCMNLNLYVNLETGSDSCLSTTNTAVLQSRTKTLHIKDDNTTVEIDGQVPSKWTVSIPNPIDTSNPDIVDMVKNHGIPIVLYRFDQDDDNLGKYERLFSDSPFISLTNAIQKIKSGL